MLTKTINALLLDILGREQRTWNHGSQRFVNENAILEKHIQHLPRERTFGHVLLVNLLSADVLTRLAKITSRYFLNRFGPIYMQNAYLSNLVSSHEVKRSVIKGRPSRTLRRIQYTVTCDATVHTLTVCRKAFLSMRGISEKRIRTVLDKQGNTGTVSKDSVKISK